MLLNENLDVSGYNRIVLQTSLVKLISHTTAKTKLAIFILLCCGEIVKSITVAQYLL